MVGAAVLWVFGLIGGSLLLASWRAGNAAEQARNAPVCAESQVFSRAVCRITLPGTVTRITSGVLVVTVDGRSVSSGVTLAGDLPDTSRGIPAAVTIYRGKVIHVEGETRLKVDTDAAPSTKSVDYRNFGYCFLVFGGAVAVYSTLKTVSERRDADRTA